jgi:SAM-dependent methyltransferase
MSTTDRETAGSAAAHGAIWGARARDWAEAQEHFARPLYEAVLRDAGVRAGTAILDVGCGAGLFCAMAAERGARVMGLDAAEGMIAVARERVPAGDFRVGEMEALPYEDRTFDLVTGFNSFQFAARPVNALIQARRVARPGATVSIATWGKPEDSEAADCLAALRPLLPPAPPDAPGPFALSADGALAALVREAGLVPRSVHEVECPFDYPDLAAALRGLLSAGPGVRAVEVSGEARVRETLTRALAPYRLSAGGYRLEQTFMFMLATA